MIALAKTPENNHLYGATVYLAGAIQYDDDNGLSWRDFISLKMKDLGIKVYSPTNKPSPFVSEISEELGAVDKYIKEKNWDAAHDYIRDKIIRVDLRMVDKSDFVIARIDPEVHTCGTYHEIILATTQKKPVFIFIKGGVKNIPRWLLGLVRPRYIFDGIGNLLCYLYEIDRSCFTLNNKWILFDEN
ncbi:MAG: hypothetical protein DRP08_07850 [Candidatus Aenigmatarchaeota archaeon]|nr:MAG: hypothetical protein DRP08_07850 [Candidatus Aenigmarchaeota archaeon]